MTETTAINAFVPGTRVHVEGSGEGPLKDLRFAAKDLFDVAGYPTGCGNHDWARHSQIPSEHAWAVQTLLDAGATRGQNDYRRDLAGHSGRKQV